MSALLENERIKQKPLQIFAVAGVGGPG